MNEEYLLLPRLEIQAANAQAAWWLINAAPVMAANLFAHNLGLKTGNKIPRRVGLIHHDAQLLGERFYGKFQPQQRRGAVFINSDDYSSKNKYALSLQPTATCHLVLSLLLAYDDGLPKLSAVADFLHGARLAGGQIIRHGKLETFDSAESVRRQLRSGYWIIERKDLLETAQGENDVLDVMIRVCSKRNTQPHAQGEKNAEAPTQEPASAPLSRQKKEDPQSWIVPTTLGYATLTNFAQRGGVRRSDYKNRGDLTPPQKEGRTEENAHAYAEPLVGLVQYLSLRQWSDRPLPLWQSHWPREDVFIVTQGEPSHD